MPVSLATIVSKISPQLLPSALIYIRNSRYDRFRCRALLDTCATANFVSQSIVNTLKLPIERHSSPVGAIGNMSIVSNGIAHITIQSTRNEFCKELTCLIIPAIVDLIPSERFPRDSIVIPTNISLADPEFHVPRTVDLLIGAGGTLSLLSVRQINLSREGHDLYLQKTRLGWIAAGDTSTTAKSRNSCCLVTLESQLKKFWEIEEMGSNTSKSKEEIDCKAHFIKNFARDQDGRYRVRLPLRETE